MPRSYARRFPAYPWDNGQQLEDEGLTILYEAADKPKTFGNVTYSTLVNEQGQLQRATRRVPAEIWQPLTAWLQKLQWTAV